MEKKMTLLKLAKELGLSVSTVSKALSDSYEISSETKKRVLELAHKYNFKPNPFASKLRMGKSKFIAVIIPEFNNNFFSVAIDAIHTIAAEKDYNVLVYLTHEMYLNEISVLSHLEIGQVDGLIMSLCSETKSYDHIEKFHEQTDLPIVFFDRIAILENFPRIITNNYEISFQATEHLFSQGAKNPVYLYSSEFNYINKERHRGFKDALIRHGLKYSDEYAVKCTEDYAINYSIIHNLLTSAKPPDAIFTSIEKLAIILYQVAKDLAIKIPDKLMVVSFSNLRTASLLNPSLTTITQPAFEMGEESVKLLFKMIEKKFYKNAKDIITVKSKLHLRESTKSII